MSYVVRNPEERFAGVEAQIIGGTLRVKPGAKFANVICCKCLVVLLTLIGNFCHLLISFVNSLGPDQDLQNVRPHPDLNHLGLW